MIVVLRAWRDGEEDKNGEDEKEEEGDTKMKRMEKIQVQYATAITDIPEW